MDKKITDFVDDFVEKIKETEDYQSYNTQVMAIQKFPELMEQINNYRKENFEIQNQFEGDELYDKMDEFSAKYESFLENPRVNDFLRAETAFCRMMQEINVRIMEGINFQ